MDGDAKFENKLLEKYTPQHPLPDEVRKMERDETVCKFCGVSYLIHNEIKALEDKLKATEQELEHYRGSQKREELLKIQLAAVNVEVEKLKEELSARDAVIGTLKNSLRISEEETNRVQTAKNELEEKHQELSSKCESIKSKHSLMYDSLSATLQKVQQQRNELTAIRDTTTTLNNVFNKERKQLQQVVVKVCSQQSEELQSKSQRLIELENERLSFLSKEAKYVSNIKAFESQISELEVKSSGASALQQQWEVLRTTNKDLESEIQGVQENSRQLRLECEQYKDQIRRLNEENSQYQSQIRQKDQNSHQQNIKLEKELKEKDNELQTVVRELGRMKTKFEEQNEELKKNSSLSTIKTKALHEELVHARGDLEALKKERELMITAHQNQIEQLRESFKKKMSQAEQWPEKLEEILKKERDKHNKELSQLEGKLKENFVYEIQIEKQKQQELSEKYVSGIKESEKLLRDQLNNTGNKHKNEVGELHKQLAEYKARSREHENSLREEIASLKKIINDLEQRLSRFDSGSDHKLTEVKFEMKKLQSEMSEVKQENKKLQTQLASAKEEVGFLQETVRRECEERFDLTEALSQAKESLLQYKRPPGGYQSPQVPRTNSKASSRASSTSVASPSSEELALYKKVARHHSPRPPKDNKDVVSSSVVLGYEGNSARNSKAGVKGNSITDIRKRISDAVGRR